MKPFIKSIVIIVACGIGLSLVSCTNSDEQKLQHLRLGKSYYEEGDLAKAHNEFGELLKLDSNVAEGYYYLALIAEKQQNWREAFANFKRAVEINPHHNEAQLHLGRLEF